MAGGKFYVNGTVTATYQFEVTKEQFDEACNWSNLNSEDYKNFSEDDWIKIRQHMKQLVIDNEYEIEYHNVHDYSTVTVDEVVADDDSTTTVLFEIEDKVDSVYIDDQKKL